MIVDFENEEMQKKLFHECFKNYSYAVAEDMAENATLVFYRPSGLWASRKIVVMYKDRLHFYPVRDDGEMSKSIISAVDTLVYEYVVGRKFGWKS